ncbi:arrestin domain-containing protein 1-like [Diorhabda sublineata]|uniref:arrestin domain-containing protein 1-like n=1 Tax=Diorhabda sublineata TaxID=1163346 RepID=UPI0024E07AE6|nr:arrestin domain-containing protein 1-like [Diorhabda sublineata]
MSCAIEVVGSDGTFSPRDTINGVVSVRLPTETHINNISCSITGKEKSAWSITENIYNQRTKNFCTGIVYYTGENTLLSDSVILTSDADVDAGVHEYPFTYMLPRNIPNSYKSNYGSIEYKIHVVVHTKTGYEYEAEKLISVKAPINFNDIRSELQLEPVAYQNEEVMWHCCYAGDPITMDLVLEREAFVVTEPICFKLDVNNKSSENIEDINVTLTLVIEATASNPRIAHRYEQILLNGAKIGKMRGGEKNIFPLKFEVPQTKEIPNFNGSSLFRQKCVLKAECLINDSENTLDVQTEIKLGHIPIDTQRRPGRRHEPVRRVHSSGAINRPLGFNFFNSSNENIPSAPPIDRPSAPWKTTDDIDTLPPSYEEAMCKSKKE